MQKHPWVVPLGALQIQFFKPFKLQYNEKLTYTTFVAQNFYGL